LEEDKEVVLESQHVMEISESKITAKLDVRRETLSKVLEHCKVYMTSQLWEHAFLQAQLREWDATFIS
jgi:hypothetical protein